MSAVPDLRGKTPACLHPFNPRHYLLLTYWIYFYPTALHCYLYRADPHLYPERGWSKFLRSWRVRAYRHLYGMGLTMLALFSGLAILAALLYHLCLLQGHTAWVNAMSVTPNGERVITASGDNTVKLPGNDGTLKVWDIDTGAAVYTLDGHRRGVTDVTVTPDGQLAISASNDSHLKIWSLQDGQLQHTLRGHDRGISAVGVTPDGEWIVSASQDNTLRLWNLQSPDEGIPLEGHEGWVNAIAISPDSRFVVSASSDRTLKVWDIANARLVHTLDGHEGRVNAVKLTPDGTQAISASADGTLKIWDIQRGVELQTLTGHTDWVGDVAIGPDGTQAVSASNDRTVRVWDLESATLLRTLSGHDSWVNAIELTDDGKLAISASNDRTVRVWDLKSGTLLHTLDGHDSWVREVIALPGRRAMSAAYERLPKLWDLDRGREVPLKHAEWMLVWAHRGFYLSLGLVAIGAILTAAVLLAIAISTFGVSGSVVSAIFFNATLCGGLIIALVLIDRLGVWDWWFRTTYDPQPLQMALALASGVSAGAIAGVALAAVNRRMTSLFGAVLLVLAASIATSAIVASVVSRPAISLKGPILSGLAVIIQVGIKFNLFVLLGALRVPIYPIQCVSALLGRNKHPIAWDELLVLPVPGTRRLVLQRLQQDPEAGLALARSVARNPFQRPFVQQALKAYLHGHGDPLRLLYGWIDGDRAHEYVRVPIAPSDWQTFPTWRKLILGELANQTVGERSIWRLTWLWRDRRRTPLVKLARVLYRLQYGDGTLDWNGSLGEQLERYPGGTEMARSLEALATLSACSTWKDLPEATRSITDLPPIETAIRPQLIRALTDCVEVGNRVGAFQSATEPGDRFVALVAANGAIARLEKYVETEVSVPEGIILKGAIARWREWLEMALSEIEGDEMAIEDKIQG